MKINKLAAAVLFIVLASLIPRLLHFDSTEIIGTVHSLRQLDVATIARNIYLDPSTFFSPTLDRGEYVNTNPPMTVGLEFQLMPLMVAILYGVFGVHTGFGPALSLLFYLGSCYFVYKLARRYLQGTGTLLAMIAFCFCSEFIVFSQTFMPESEVIFFLTCSYYLFLKYLDAPTNKGLAVSFIVLTLSMLVKLTNAYMLPVYLFLLIKNKMPKSRLIVALSAGGASFGITLLYYYLVNRNADTPYVSGILNNLILKNLGDQFVDIDFWSMFLKYGVIYFSPLGLLFAIVGISAIARKHTELIVWLSCVILFEYVSGYSILVNHIYYYLPMVAIGALLIGAGADKTYNYLSDKVKFRFVVKFAYVLAGVFLVSQLLFLYSRYGFTGDPDYARQQRQDGEHLRTVLQEREMGDRSKIALLRWEEYPVLYYSEQIGWMIGYNEDTNAIKSTIDELTAKDCKYLYIASRDIETPAAQYLIGSYPKVDSPTLMGTLLILK